MNNVCAHEHDMARYGVECTIYIRSPQLWDSSMMELCEMTLWSVCLSRPDPQSDWLDPGAGWGCTPNGHSLINVHRLTQPSAHTHTHTHTLWGISCMAARSTSSYHCQSTSTLNCFPHITVLLSLSGAAGPAGVWRGRCNRHNPCLCLIPSHGNIPQFTLSLDII